MQATAAPMDQGLTVLGIESSCDDTAAAVVRAGDGERQILSSVVAGQTDLHSAFGGVVPELAARAHAEKLDLCVEAALDRAGLGLDRIDAVAVTAGPGLIGGVMAGVMCAKGIAAGAGLPLVGVNHLAGHALTPRLTDGLAFPYLMLLVSGGHCQFLRVEGAERFHRLGGTIDDAPGEAFDKTAKLLGLPQPGGPAVEAEAKAGDPARFAFPRPLLDRPGCDLSFSGLKTALVRARLVPGRGGGGSGGKGAPGPGGPRRGFDGLRRGRRGGGEQHDPRRAGGRGTGGGPAFRRAALVALHRQCRDDRLGRDRAAARRPS